MRWSSLTLSFDVRTKHKSSIFCKSWCVPYRESKGNFSEWDNSFEFAWSPSPTKEVLIAKIPIHTVEHAQVEDFKKISLTTCAWGGGGRLLLSKTRWVDPMTCLREGRTTYRHKKLLDRKMKKKKIIFAPFHQCCQLFLQPPHSLLSDELSLSSFSLYRGLIAAAARDFLWA